MERKCFVNGCSEVPSLVWELDGCFTYACAGHGIQDFSGVLSGKHFGGAQRSKKANGHKGGNIIWLCFFVGFCVAILNFFINQNYLTDQLEKNLSDLKSVSSFSSKFKKEVAEINSIINELKPSRKPKKKFSSIKDKINEKPAKEKKVLSKDEAISALIGSELSIDKKKSILVESLFINFDSQTSEVLCITFVDNGLGLVYGTMSGFIYQSNLDDFNVTLVAKLSNRIYNILPIPNNDSFAVIGSSVLNTLELPDKKLAKGSISHTQWILSTIFSSHNSLIITGSCDKLIKVWNASNSEFLFKLKGHSAEIWSLAISKDDRFLFSTGEQGEVFMWDLVKWTLIENFSGHKGAVYSVLITKDQENIVTGSGDGTIRIWNIKNSSDFHVLHHVGLVRNLLLYNNDQNLISISGNTLKIWDFNQRKQLITYSHPSNLISLSLSPDEKTLATGDDSNRIWLWDLASNTLKHVLGGSQRKIEIIKVSKDLAHLAIIEKGLIRIWQLNTMSLTTIITQKSEASKWEDFLDTEEILSMLK